MSADSFLPLFINEEIYLLDDSQTKQDPVFLGGNKKEVLILVSNPTVAFLSATEDELLQKILLSVELTYDDVAILNVAKSDIKEIDFGKVLSFGVTVQPQSNSYQVEEIDGKQWLLVDSLPDIAQDRSKKKLLWEHLQQLFPD